MDEQQIWNEPYPLQWGDRTLKLGLITQGVKARFTADRKAAAMAEFREYMVLKYGPDPATEEKAMMYAEEKAFRDDMTSGRYKWGGDLAEAWRMHSLEGQKAFVRQLLVEGGTPLSDDDLGEMMGECQAELVELQNQIVRDSEAPKAMRLRRMLAARAANGVAPDCSTTLPPSSANPTDAPTKS